jgi:RNA polymerase sigma-70 factor (ECF subfamily)
MDQQPKKQKERRRGRKKSQSQDQNGREHGLPDLPRMIYRKLRHRLLNDADLQRRVGAVLRQFYPIPQDREDAFQQILVALQEHPNSRTSSPAGGWLYTVLRNRRRDGYRRDQTAKDHRQELEWQTEAADRQRWTAEDPAQQAMCNELAAAYEAALAELSAYERELFTLREEQGWTYEKLADKYGGSSVAMRVRLHRIRLRLRELLGPYIDAA